MVIRHNFRPALMNNNTPDSASRWLCLSIHFGTKHIWNVSAFISCFALVLREGKLLFAVSVANCLLLLGTIAACSVLLLGRLVMLWQRTSAHLIFLDVG